MVQITVQLTGKKPLLQRNGRLANPADPLTREVAALAGKRRKTDDDYRVLLPLEAYAGCWETPDKLLGLPTQNLWRSIQTAATAFRHGKNITRALLFDIEEVAPLLVSGQPVNAHTFAYDPVNLFIRTVVINRMRTLRSRVIVRDWQSTHTFQLLDDVINPQDLQPILARAGRLEGVGDWRPLYGTYAVEVLACEPIAEDEAA